MLEAIQKEISFKSRFSNAIAIKLYPMTAAKLNGSLLFNPQNGVCRFSFLTNTVGMHIAFQSKLPNQPSRVVTCSPMSFQSLGSGAGLYASNSVLDDAVSGSVSIGSLLSIEQKEREKGQLCGPAYSVTRKKNDGGWRAAIKQDFVPRISSYCSAKKRITIFFERKGKVEIT